MFYDITESSPFLESPLGRVEGWCHIGHGRGGRRRVVVDRQLNNLRGFF
jgi:hypothetical protein